VGHLRQHGFAVKGIDVTNLDPIKTQHGVPADLQSCHTALVNGYVIEGHVPADLIVRVLRERPPVLGLAVPGMPAGSHCTDLFSERARQKTAWGSLTRAAIQAMIVDLGEHSASGLLVPQVERNPKPRLLEVADIYAYAGARANGPAHDQLQERFRDLCRSIVPQWMDFNFSKAQVWNGTAEHVRQHPRVAATPLQTTSFVTVGRRLPRPLNLVKLEDAPREGFVRPQRGGHLRQCGNSRGSDARSRVLVWVVFGLKLTAFGLL
jgi:Protein of unknown function, DUF